jgi:hypothetical protein
MTPKFNHFLFSFIIVYISLSDFKFVSLVLLLYFFPDVFLTFLLRACFCVFVLFCVCVFLLAL